MAKWECGKFRKGENGKRGKVGKGQSGRRQNTKGQNKNKLVAKWEGANWEYILSSSEFLLFPQCLVLFVGEININLDTFELLSSNPFALD